MEHRNSILSLRKIDIGLILGVFTMGAMFWRLYAKPAQWDQTTKDVEAIKPKVESHEIALAVINEQYAQISRQLTRIERK